MLKSLWISLPITLICAYAQAQTAAAVTAKAPAKPAAAAATSTVAAPAAPAPNPVSFSMSIGADYSVQANPQTAKDGTVSRNEAMAYSFSPAMSFGDGYRLSSYLEYDQTLTDSQDNGWIDPSISLSRKGWELGKYFKLGPSGSVVIPTTASTRNDLGLQTAASIRGGLSLQTKALGLDALSVSYGLMYTRYFTDFATKADGSPVNQHRIRQQLDLGYQIIDPLSVSTMFRYESKYSSEGVVRGNFIWSQSLEYSVTDSLSVSVGHANSGGVLKKDGDNYKNGIAFDSPENSEYSMGVSLSL